MLKTSLFILAIGFVILIAGLVAEGEQRLWTLLLAAVLIGGGFLMYSRAERRDDPDDPY